jgi:hypothetical protein
MELTGEHERFLVEKHLSASDSVDYRQNKSSYMRLNDDENSAS